MLKVSKSALLQILLTTLFAVGVFLFWRFAHPEALACAEELQLFLFTPEYFFERLTYPGGIATYLGEFITQFYNLISLGAAILALLFVVIQRLTWRLMCSEGVDDCHYPLSFAPAILLLAIMGDENVLAPYVVSIILGLVACLIFSHFTTSTLSAQRAALALLIPVFCFAGSGIYVLCAYAIAKSIKRRNYLEPVLIIIYLALCTTIGYRISAYPLSRVLIGIGIYRMADAPILLPLFLVFVGLVPALTSLLKMKMSRVSAIAELGLIVVFAFLLPHLTFDEFKYRIMRYDLLLRKRDWNEVLSLAKRHEPHSPLELATVNFSLAMRGELPNRMFEFPQVNSEGLLPVFSREVFTTMMTSDIYYELGMLNTARRFAFEAQESIPNSQKSGRLTKRLAEVAIIDGHYELARRYLHLLKQTFAYRKWAADSEALITDEAKVNAHPVYGRMRHRRVTTDFFYSDPEMDQMLGLLFNQDKSNRMALDYLLTCELLTRNLAAFARYIPLMGQLPDGGMGPIPRAYQEALCMVWAQHHSNFDGIPWPIDPTIRRNFIQFAQLTAPNGAQTPLPSHLASSYWAFFIKR